MANYEGATSSSATKFSYDVFLSFRGKDTREGFTGNLYKALCHAGINTFMDNRELKVGTPIGPVLLSAIEESKMAIVVFSENYAESSWCLDEFAKIMECHKHNNQMVFPVFYKVKPSDLRHLRGGYGHAMIKHQRDKRRVDSNKIAKWKSSLVEGANLKGYHFNGQGYEYECKIIKEIVSEVTLKLSPRSLDINEHIVGLNDQVEELKSNLEIGFNYTTFFLGIPGIGGIGKTTLAKVLYNSICNQFEGSCFLSNVRETSMQYEGLKHTVERLLTDILKEGTIHLTSVDEGIKTIQRKLGKKRVLLVLDDVDHIMQLEVLAGRRDWFGSGSRIIITTGDMHLLRLHEVEKIHEMKVLNDHHSMELFCHNAFKLNCPATNYEEISNRAVRYAKGLPLALKVLGSHLFGKEIDEWESALDKYEKIPHKDIHSILRISYDDLESNEQYIFLDIACFFKGQKMEYVKTILKACDFFPGDGIRILVDRSLITVEGSCLMMHDLIQQMGREIVREEKPRDASKRSRLWFHEDVLQVLKNDTASSEIEGIMFDPPQREEEIEWIDTAFQKMDNLRILIIRNTTFSSAPTFLPNQIRLLEWKQYTSQSFPPRFKPNKIAAFKLCGSLLVQPFQACEHLTYMDVSHCNSITQIPNVSGAMSLRELKVDGCENLVIVDESVGFLPNLVYFSASGCFELRSFVPEIYLPSLEYLSFNLCRKLEHFPEVVGMMDKALSIYLMDTSIEELPDSISKLTGLEYLEMTSCNRLRHLPGSLFTLPKLVTLKVGGCSRLPESFRGHEVSMLVRTLHFNGADVSDEDLPMIIDSFPNLEDLDMSSNYFAYFPACIQDCIFLTSLDVSECSRLVEIPELPPRVQKVSARHCNSLNAETLDMLWSQVSKNIKELQVVMPGTSREILECQWFKFNHTGLGGVPHFKARGMFPVVAIAFAFKQLSAKGPLPTHWETVRLQLVIEGEVVHRKQNQTFYAADNHVLLCDLRVMFDDKELEGLNARLGHDWKTVRVVCETSMTLIWWGVYVYMGETNMDDIQFNTGHDHSMVPWVPLLNISQEDRLQNQMESINVPAMTNEILRDLRNIEERGEFGNVAPGFHENNQSLLRSLGNMSSWVTTQRDGNNSRSGLEDEDSREGQSMVRWILETISKEGKEDDIRHNVRRQHTIRERQSYEGETSGQGSQDDGDAIKVQYNIFDFTKQ